MSNKIMSALLVCVMGIAFSAEANACSKKSISGGNQVIQSGKRINASLLDAAVRVEVNYHRCRAGLSGLRSNIKLRDTAKGHSNWMARARNMTHKSTISGRRTLSDRVNKSGLRWKAISENIGKTYRFQVEQKVFYVDDIAACQFTNASGQMIQPHSYQSLARHIVGLWMASPSHRRNILDRRMQMVGSAVSFDSKAHYCGTFYVTQNFAK